MNMFRALPFLASCLPLAAAWASAMNLEAAVLKYSSRSTARLNTGAAHPFPAFDAQAQFVNVSLGSGHEFQPPGHGDLRGQCPGLNAAANHGFLPRDGKVTILQAIKGLGDAYNMDPILAGFLAALAVVVSGDIPTATWSIGGGYNSTLPGILSNPVGILGTHNRYEGDASFTRGDAYLNQGNVNVFQNRAWNNVENLIGDNLSLDKAAQLSHNNTRWSVENNPYYFSSPIGGFVSPVAYQFAVNLMSNHSAEVPGGVLGREVLASFFAVTGDKSNYVHHPGQERIPENWYRRPGGLGQYSLPDAVLDLIVSTGEYPDILHFGGNTGQVNTFTGVDLSDLTGGVFNSATLLEGNNLACFVYQLSESLLGPLYALGGIVETLLGPLLGYLSTPFDKLGCPQLKEVNTEAFGKFPGYGQ